MSKLLDKAIEKLLEKRLQEFYETATPEQQEQLQAMADQLGQMLDEGGSSGDEIDEEQTDIIESEEK